MDYLIDHRSHKISLEDQSLLNLYIENLPKIRWNNKSIILDWVYKNTEFLRDYILISTYSNDWKKLI